MDFLKKIKNKNEELDLKTDFGYFIDGVKTKYSVSKICTPIFPEIPNIEYYIEIGLSIHTTVEKAQENKPYTDDYEKCELLDSVYENALKWLQNKSVLATEQPVCSPKQSIGGRIDTIYEEDGKVVLCDFKSSKNISTAHRNQLNIYYLLLTEVYGLKIDKLELIKIDKETGEFTPTEIKVKPRKTMIKMMKKNMEVLDNLELEKTLDKFETL